VGGRAVHRRGDIVNQIALASPGETLTLELDRGEDRLRIDLVPTARPAN
jgi:S1-C subfamily serine protease